MSHIESRTAGGNSRDNARLPAPVTECSDCGTVRSITGDVPIDLYHLKDGTQSGITLFLCLGDLASRRALGQDVARVEAVG